ncbi:hypothetical protein X560_1798 [Listeria fleischmannii 1991]|uniref:Uncharacterized protein n=1 Tax=Listeria fleischmannii 1991 TaxID=1430899 RepID=A0A0J8G963_9LIST|nr:hypothetical protein X560_1798 [Listeria fleischmannii 1991]
MVQAIQQKQNDFMRTNQEVALLTQEHGKNINKSLGIW